MCENSIFLNLCKNCTKFVLLYDIKNLKIICFMKKIAFFLVCFLSFSIAMVAQDTTKSSVKKTLPSVELKDINGKKINTAELTNDGNPIIISFWATWCKPCVTELRAIADQYDDWQAETGVKLIAVSVDDSKTSGNVKPFVNGNSWDYEVLLDVNGEFKRAMNVNLVPHTFVLNGQGEIIWQHTTYAPGAENELYEAVKSVAKKH
jgi:peroxiredoxin